MLSPAEENYLKSIYLLSGREHKPVNTNTLSEHLKTRPASVSDMIRKLSLKHLVAYEKYKGVALTSIGEKSAMDVLKRQRLWKVFLVEKLHFDWTETEDVSGQLEHIGSPLLIARLDAFLEHPRFDPTGELIPDEKDEEPWDTRKTLSSIHSGISGILMSVNDTSSAFLKYLEKSGITLGCIIKVIDITDYDGSMEILIDNRHFRTLSKKVSDNLVVKPD